jgi:Sec-independent protein secretion pathway component TatC
MFAIGVKEALCVALFTAFVWAAHTALRLLVPIRDHRPRYVRPKGLRRNLLVAAGALVVSFLAGLLLARPLWTAAVDVLRSRVGFPAMELVVFSPDESATTMRFTVPLLIGIFLASPAWIALLMKFCGPDRASLLASATYLLGGVLGFILVLPSASTFGMGDWFGPHPVVGVQQYASVLWNATVGPGLILLAAPLSFRAAKPRLPTARMWVFLTPLLMLAAALGTATTDIFSLIVVFLPMCVACMAGIVSAEVANALSKEVRVPMSKVIAWAVRFSAESILAAGIALLILWR